MDDDLSGRTSEISFESGSTRLANETASSKPCWFIPRFNMSRAPQHSIGIVEVAEAHSWEAATDSCMLVQGDALAQMSEAV